jgi:hypothetical protein
MSNPKGRRRTVYRDSKDGRFVTERYAKVHPDTTERERVIVPRR